jgi:glutathionylspermidine synthase
LSAAIEGEPAAQRLGRYARKPLLAREGADIALVGAGDRIEGEKRGYGGEGYVRQDLCMLPDFGAYPVVGAWIVGDEPAGMGIREDRSPITSPRARFVPHLILE